MSTGTATVANDILNLLKKAGLVSAREYTHGADKINLELLKGDGSSRTFIRVFRAGEPLCVAVLPGSAEQKDMAESQAALEIGRHLGESGTPVPAILAADETSGLIFFEDLGDLRLYEVIRHSPERGYQLYREAVKLLAAMQVRGAEGFNPGWCFDSPSYDRSVMLERESGYFLSAFWQGTLRQGNVDGLQEELSWLADQALVLFDSLFLHRDFQCRNIMICRDKIRIIDFQAGRLGPPGYDIASLLIDPYAGLPVALQAELFQTYLKEMDTFPGVDIGRIISSYPYLAVQRNLQIIAAFAFLSEYKGKHFFLQFILPSLTMLRNQLDVKTFEPLTLLRNTVSEAITKYRLHMRR